MKSQELVGHEVRREELHNLFKYFNERRSTVGTLLPASVLADPASSEWLSTYFNIKGHLFHFSRACKGNWNTSKCDKVNLF